jgi:predicted DNA-binding ribbon-helix-helix protein
VIEQYEQREALAGTTITYSSGDITPSRNDLLAVKYQYDLKISTTSSTSRMSFQARGALGFYRLGRFFFWRVVQISNLRSMVLERVLRGKCHSKSVHISSRNICSAQHKARIQPDQIVRILIG